MLARAVSVLAFGHQQFGEESPVGQVLAFGPADDAPNWARIVGSRSTRHAVSMAASEAGSVRVWFWLVMTTPSGTTQELVPRLQGGQRSVIDGQLGNSAHGQAGDLRIRSGRRRLKARGVGADGRGPAADLGDFAGLQRDDIMGEGAHRQGGPDAGEHVGVLQMAVQQQDLDQGLGALDVAQGRLRRGPECLVGGGEGAVRPGLVEGFGAGEGAGLAQEGLQEVVQDDVFLAPPRQAGMPGDLGAAVVLDWAPQVDIEWGLPDLPVVADAGYGDASGFREG